MTDDEKKFVTALRAEDYKDFLSPKKKPSVQQVLAPSVQQVLAPVALPPQSMSSS